MKNFLFLTLTVCILSCKNENKIAELGKTAPNYTFSNILNSEVDNISINDLKGKTVILEFWATWCGPCIPAMKKLDSLQKEFKDELEIITVSSESAERLQKFITSSNTSLKIVSDSIHSENFRYKSIPHSIIIDKQGIVRAITNPNNINSNVIHNLMANNEIDLEVKDDFYIDPDLTVETLKAEANADFRLELKNYNQEKRGGYSLFRDSEGNTKGIEMWNSTIPRLYQTLFDVASPSRMIYKDSLSKKDFPYEEAHQYNLTIEVSDKYQDKWEELGIDFLNEYFNVNAKMGIDSMDCFVLKNVDSTLLESQSDSSYFNFRGTILNTKKIKMSQLAEYLENFTAIPVLDKTNLNGVYDIELDWQAEDSQTLHAELRKYGLKFEKSAKKLPVEVMEIYKK